jgi:hypothetical protein
MPIHGPRELWGLYSSLAPWRNLENPGIDLENPGKSRNGAGKYRKILEWTRKTLG